MTSPHSNASSHSALPHAAAAADAYTDHYAALGVSSGAGLVDIKKAFRQQAARFHPDRNDHPDAPARFRAVQQAYEVLSDAERRQAYDDNRRRNLLDDPADTARSIWNAYWAGVLQNGAAPPTERP